MYGWRDVKPRYIYDQDRRVLVKNKDYSRAPEVSETPYYHEAYHPASSRSRRRLPPRSESRQESDISSMDGVSWSPEQIGNKKSRVRTTLSNLKDKTLGPSKREPYPLPDPIAGGKRPEEHQIARKPTAPALPPRDATKASSTTSPKPLALEGGEGRSAPSENNGPNRAPTAGSTAADDMTGTAETKLLKIASLILQHAQYDPNLKGKWVEDPVGAVRHLLSKYTSLYNELKGLDKTFGSISGLESSRDLQTRLKGAQDDLQHFKNLYSTSEAALGKTKTDLAESERRNSAVRKAETEWKKERKELLGYKDHCAELHHENESRKNRESIWLHDQSELLKNHERALQHAREESKPEIARLLNQINGFQTEKQLTIDAHQKQLRRVEEGHQKYVGELESYWKLEVEGVKARALEAAKSTYIDQINALNQQIEEDADQFASDLRFETERLQSLIDNLQGQIDRMNVNHPKELEELKKSMKEEQEREIQALKVVSEAKLKKLQYDYDNLDQNWKEKTAKLRNDYERLKVDYMDKRDHYQGLTDLELTDRFKRLATKIEQLSMRLKWDPMRESKWPMSEPRLRQFNPENVRRLKQQILQNSMWMTLHEEIFGTPFVVLGQEGERLYSEWTNKFSSNPSSNKWPKASTAAERWRCDTAKLFFDALERTGPLPDMDRKRRDVFEASVARIAKSMFKSIGRVVSIGLNDQQTVRDIIDQAGRLWLEVCSQRYRIRVDYPYYDNDSNIDILTDNRSNYNFLALIIRPELKRVGNSLGEDLTSEENVSGWQADMVTHEPS